jgi:copper chaperone CopZ
MALHAFGLAKEASGAQVAAPVQTYNHVFYFEKGMLFCDNCPNTIKNALLQKEGVTNVQVFWADGRLGKADIQATAAITTDDLTQILGSVGYPPLPPKLRKHIGKVKLF